MSTFDYSHELVFNTVFDSNVITNSEIQDKSTDFISKVHDEFEKITTILNLHNGIKTLSSFVEWDTKRYKVTIHK
jgi:hypothetical protein